MLKQRKHDDDDDFDERGVLKEGRQMRVLDARPPDVAKHSGRRHDGSGNHQLIHHMPGFSDRQRRLHGRRAPARPRRARSVSARHRCGVEARRRRLASPRGDERAYEASLLR